MRKLFRFEWIILGIFLILIFSFIFYSSSSKVAKFIRQGKRINILLLGCDELKYSKHSDIIILSSYEPKANFLDILSIPRDTKVPCDRKIYWRGYRKINEIYFLAYRKGKDVHKACREVAKKVEGEIGIEIPFYIQVSYKAFCDLIDVLGGIEINIEQKMVYDDNWGNLHIHFKPGSQKLNGESVLKYIRYREKLLGDMGRILRQQKFLNIFSKIIKKPTTIFLLPKIYRAVIRNVWTNLNFWDFFFLANEVKDLSRKNIRIQILPGESEYIRGSDYWIIDKEMTKDVVSVILTDQKRRKVKLNSKLLNNGIVVEVWNATKRKDLAYNLQKNLRKYGIDTVRWGNYGVYKNYTVIVDRKGNLESVYRVASIIGCKRVKTELDKSRLVDISIVLGNDFKSANVAK